MSRKITACCGANGLICDQCGDCPAPREPRPLPLVKAPRAFTPVANATAARKRVAAGKPSTLAEAIARHKTLQYGQPEHTAFLRGGLNEWNQWKAAQ